MKRNQIYSFEDLHGVMAVYDREFGISFPRIRPKLESWDLRKSHDNKQKPDYVKWGLIAIVTYGCEVRYEARNAINTKLGGIIIINNLLRTRYGSQDIIPRNCALTRSTSVIQEL